MHHVAAAKPPAPNSKNNKPKVLTITTSPILIFLLLTSLTEQGLGADNAPGRTEGLDKHPGEAPVASDSGSTNVGVEAGTNQPGEKGIDGKPVDPQMEGGGANMK